MSNIIFLLSSIRVKINVNEMENGEGRERGVGLIAAVMTSLGRVESGGRTLIGLEKRKDRNVKR